MHVNILKRCYLDNISTSYTNRVYINTEMDMYVNNKSIRLYNKLR